MKIIKNSNKKSLHLLLITIAILFIACSLQANFAANDLTVNQTAPSGGTVHNNISSAINDAQHGDTITIDPGTYKGSNNNNTNLTIGKNLTIQGNGPRENVIIDGENTNRIFTIAADNLNVTFINLTFQNGLAPGGGAIYNIDFYNSVLNFINCSFINNNCTL